MTGSLLFGFLFYAYAQASPLPRAAAVDPVVKGTPQVLGLVSDPSLNRDSCGSVNVNGRLLWTCRDTQQNNDLGLPDVNIIGSSTASWSDLNFDGTPKMDLMAESPNGFGNLMQAVDPGQPYFAYPTGECETSPAGSCDDGTRWVLWPDSPPMATGFTDINGNYPAYTWVRQSHIDGDLTELNPDPPTALYRIDFPADSTDNATPPITKVNDAIWGDQEISYGSYGNVVRNGTAYLYAKPTSGQVALAKVSTGSIEDSSQYQFWVNGAWSTTKPAVGDNNYDTHATAGGQGTFYYSDVWSSYVWIGQGSMSVSADFYVTTSPQPQGPWTEPKLIYSGENGNYDLGAYSLQANPGMSAAGNNSIYLTYTKNDLVDDINVYSTPLILVEWE